MAAKDYRAIFRALSEQGWEQEESGGGHWKLFPPDKSAPIVCIATTSGDPRAIKNTIRDLRGSGFVWPWPPDSKKQSGNNNAEEEEEPMGEVLPIRTETPTEPEAVNVDDLFRQLKEARNYAALAREARDEAKAARDRAEAALVGSEKELELAVTQLKNCKDAFDKAFSSEGK